MYIVKKIILVLIIGWIVTLAVGCQSDNSLDNDVGNDFATSDNVNTLSEGWEGELAWFVVKGLANGFLSDAGGEIFGNVLVLAGLGDPDNAEEEKTLKNIDMTLGQIKAELSHIDDELDDLKTELHIDTDKILIATKWPAESITPINTGTRHLHDIMTNPDGTFKKPGEANQTDILTLADNVINKWDIDNAIQGIHDSILDNLFPIFIDEAITSLSGNDTHLMEAYKGFENFSTKILNIEILGANLVVEAHKAHDDNRTAQLRYNDYKDMLYTEVSDMGNPNSFIYNAIKLVLNFATLYEDNKLSSDAISILKRSLFYRMLYTGIDKDKFGLRFLYISPASYPIEFTPLYAYSKSNKNYYICENNGHYEVLGRTYDNWNANGVDAKNNYNVSEYHCDNVPVGEYEIYPENNLHSKQLGLVKVSNYNADYTQTDDGNITYGFGQFFDFTNNRFNASSTLWTHHSKVDGWGSITDDKSWPISIETSHSAWESNDLDDHMTGYTEIRGNFKYTGSETRKITVYYEADFMLYASVEARNKNQVFGYSTGVHKVKPSQSECKHTYSKELKTKLINNYIINDEKRKVNHTCSFTVKTGDEFYIYFKPFIEAYTGLFSVLRLFPVLESHLLKVHKVHVKFEE